MNLRGSRRLVWAVAVLTLAACDNPDPTDSPAAALSSPSVAETTPNSSATAIQPAASGEGGWGPLAVTTETSRDFALVVGVLRITDVCTFVDRPNGEPYLLVWPSARTTWDPARGAIHFENPSGEIVLLRDGDGVQLGGGGASLAGPEASDGAPEPAWAAAPDPSCAANTWWFVGDVGAD